jgi:saccharopine dehydrogenase-like NADP-dependent oxidoreductase
MNKRIIVLGAGLVGNAMAIDLKKSGNDVCSVDMNRGALEVLSDQYGIETIEADFSEPAVLARVTTDADLVVGAAPGALGYGVMEQVIANGKDMVDISFCPEDYLELDALARKNNVTVVADMGVAPGMCNAILGYHDAAMEVASYKCIVGGLPVKREWPLEYKSSWSPIDCIEEYIRPARFIQGGRLVTKPALSDAELVDIEGIGTLEEWNSDGLRSLLKTMPHIPDMVEKTLRYPGTINYIRALRDLGYFSYEEVEVDGKMIRPIDLSARLLFPLWHLEKGEKEYTVMRVTIEGAEKGVRKRYTYDLYDEYDPVTNTLSMARTTGYACTGVAGLLLSGRITEKGVLPPERIGAHRVAFEYLLHFLRERDIVYTVSEQIL